MWNRRPGKEKNGSENYLFLVSGLLPTGLQRVKSCRKML
jgi:hypothetical protein